MAFNGNIDQVQQVLKLLHNAGVTLKLKECELSSNCIDFFGQAI